MPTQFKIMLGEETLHGRAIAELRDRVALCEQPGYSFVKSRVAREGDEAIPLPFPSTPG